MSYVSRTLGSKERVYFLTGYHWFYWIGTGLLLAPMFVTIIATFPYGGTAFIWFALAAIPAIYGVYYAIHGMALEVAVTTDRFVKKTGLVSIESEEVSLDKIEEVNVAETIFGRIFGYGSVDVHGTGAGAIHIKMITDPVRLRREIQSAREQLKTKGE